MSGDPCLHYDCTNRNSFGYCKTTVCINEHYQLEQWGLPSTTNKSESVVIKQQTDADRLRAMKDFGGFEVLNLLSSAWYGKQYYFLQDNGMVYSRDSGKYMTFDDAITEFASKIGDDGSI